MLIAIIILSILLAIQTVRVWIWRSLHSEVAKRWQKWIEKAESQQEEWPEEIS